MNTIWEATEGTGRTEVQAHTARRFPFVADVCQKKGLGHIKALCWRVTWARSGFKCHGGSLGIPAQLGVACCCPINRPEHTSTQCYYCSHWRNTEVNPLCWGTWCHGIVIYRKRQQLWLRVSTEWHTTDSCNAIPRPACNSSCRCRERFFSPLILRIAVSRMKTTFSQVLLPTLTWTTASKHKSQRATTIALSVLLSYRNLSHTKSLSRKGTVEIQEIQAGAGKFWWKHHSSNEVADTTARKWHHNLIDSSTEGNTMPKMGGKLMNHLLPVKRATLGSLKIKKVIQRGQEQEEVIRSESEVKSQWMEMRIKMGKERRIKFLQDKGF